ncbi:DUF1893 domain-containing protein [Candidatus Bathyarchaeota archaeon]|nr:DUF1893 domain-containing protein [Candidatus Bathyarchaeota archaeon]
MKDLDIAKQRLKENNLTMSIVKNGKTIFENSSHGISGFLEAIEKRSDTLKGASVADKITGKAIALLCVYSKVKAVYAVILSKKARTLLEKYKVYHEWNKLVENILDTSGTDKCPFEKLADEISDPENAYGKLKALQVSLKHCKDESK